MLYAAFAMLITRCHYIVSFFKFPSVLWRCWLGDRKGIRPVKSWALVYWWWHFTEALHDLQRQLSPPLPSSLSSEWLANLGLPEKWLLKWSERDCTFKISVNVYYVVVIGFTAPVHYYSNNSCRLHWSAFPKLVLHVICNVLLNIFDLCFLYCEKQ